MASPAEQASSVSDDPIKQMVSAAWSNFVLQFVLRLAYGKPLLAAGVVFRDLSLVVFALSMRWFDRSPLGSAERRWARLALWVTSSSLAVGGAWWLAGPPTWEAVVWAVVAFVAVLIWLMQAQL